MICCFSVCEPGHYIGNGTDKCNYTCSRTCVQTNGVCSWYDGTCLAGCQTGYWGDTCQDTCTSDCIGGCNRSNGTMYRHLAHSPLSVTPSTKNTLKHGSPWWQFSPWASIFQYIFVVWGKTRKWRIAIFIKTVKWRIAILSLMSL